MEVSVKTKDLYVKKVQAQFQYQDGQTTTVETLLPFYTIEEVS